MPENTTTTRPAWLLTLGCALALALPSGSALAKSSQAGGLPAAREDIATLMDVVCGGNPDDCAAVPACPCFSPGVLEVNVHPGPPAAAPDW
jgi:hypothetical protein